LRAALGYRRIKVLHILGASNYDSRNILDFICDRLHEGSATELHYITLDEGPVYEVLRNPVRVLPRKNPIGYIEGTWILTERMFSWVSNM
jgi:hypothetical protein